MKKKKDRVYLLSVNSGLRADPERVLNYLIKLARGDEGYNR